MLATPSATTVWRRTAAACAGRAGTPSICSRGTRLGRRRTDPATPVAPWEQCADQVP